jgi:hypothetical protein
MLMILSYGSIYAASPPQCAPPPGFEDGLNRVR